jgi:hypothetical protein
MGRIEEAADWPSVRLGRSLSSHVGRIDPDAGR